MQVSIPSQRRYVGYWEKAMSQAGGLDLASSPYVNLPQPCTRELQHIRLYDTAGISQVFVVVSELQEVMKICFFYRFNWFIYDNITKSFCRYQSSAIGLQLKSRKHVVGGSERITRSHTNRDTTTRSWRVMTRRRMRSRAWLSRWTPKAPLSTKRHVSAITTRSHCQYDSHSFLGHPELNNSFF